MRRLLVFLLVCGAFFAVVGSAYAGAGGARPFKLRGSGTVTLSEFFDSASSGRVTGSLLGRGTFENTAVLYGAPPVCGSEFEKPTQIVSGSYTAADGDSLSGVTVQTWCVERASPSCPEPDVCFDASGTYAIEVGSGRFADARGSGAAVARAVFPSFGPDAVGALTFTDVGEINDVGGA